MRILLDTPYDNIQAKTSDTSNASCIEGICISIVRLVHRSELVFAFVSSNIVRRSGTQ
jgi:hypothetical protein